MTMTPRPTTYKGIKMRSRLEAGFAQWLDKWNFNWEYEPECFAHERGQYLPDFLLRSVWVIDGPRDVYVEVKPKVPEAEGLNAQWEVILSSRPDVVCVLASPDPELVDFLHGFWGVLGRYPGVPHVRADGDTVLNATFWAHSGNSLGLFRVVKDGPWPDGYWVAS